MATPSIPVIYPAGSYLRRGSWTLSPGKDIVPAALDSVGGLEFYLTEQKASRYSELETARLCLHTWEKLRGEADLPQRVRAEAPAETGPPEAKAKAPIPPRPRPLDLIYARCAARHPW